MVKESGLYQWPGTEGFLMNNEANLFQVSYICAMAESRIS
jgi:hypothetical protein